MMNYVTQLLYKKVFFPDKLELLHLEFNVNREIFCVHQVM